MSIIFILMLAAVLVIWAFQLFAETAKHDTDMLKVHRKGTTPLADTEDEPAVDRAAARKKKIIFAAVLCGVGGVILFAAFQLVSLTKTGVSAMETAMMSCMEEFGLDQQSLEGVELDLETYLQEHNVSTKKELDELFSECVTENISTQNNVVGEFLRTAGWN